MELDTLCPQCRARQTLLLEDRARLACGDCGKNLLEFSTDRFIESEDLKQCPVCGCVHLYRQKDFNRKIGMAILVLGIALAYFTYGISLIAVTLLDISLVRRVKEIGCCYKCGAIFRHSQAISQLEPFNLSLHDYYRNLREKGSSG